MDNAADLKARFGRLVAAHRHRLGMTQAALAEASELSSDMIARIETGGTGVRFPNIQKLSTALGVDPAELFSSPMPPGAERRPALINLTARLSALSDSDLVWLTDLIEVALKTRR